MRRRADLHYSRIYQYGVEPFFPLAGGVQTVTLKSGKFLQEQQVRRDSNPHGQFWRL